MRDAHLAFLAGEGWARMLRTDLLPWLLAGGDLGDDVLEIGPGPGLTTDLLRELTPAVTAVELDPRLARSLRERLAGTSVEVVHGDAVRSGFADGRFSAVTCFHVLHHVPTPAGQDAVFREGARVLRPGGAFLCADALDLPGTRNAHEEQGETFQPLDPDRLPRRLEEAGFGAVELRAADYQLLVRAVR
jgi:SAM-dependent methyltransferase